MEKGILGFSWNMSLERVHIGIFGKVNSGKSSFVNALTGQDLSVVSEIEGTTTDPVRKAMEILPIGPVMIYDTAGLSDSGTLGKKRMDKSYEVLRKIDIAVIVIDAGDVVNSGYNFFDEKKILSYINKKAVPFLVVLNKIDLLTQSEVSNITESVAKKLGLSTEKIIHFSAKNAGIQEITSIREIISGIPIAQKARPLVSDLISSGDMIVMVVPIDDSAPKGRIILPQQQVLRDILDTGASAVVCQPEELKGVLENLNNNPALVITDSQAFNIIKNIVPADVPLTSFSILMARYKGNLEWQAAGAKTIDDLEEGACILISEGCTHHRQCGDIGTVKLPAMIKKRTGKDFEFEFTSGGDFPVDLDRFSLVIHCGGCTLPPKEMKYRINLVRNAGIPITNYGMMIAYINGILNRSLAIFGEKEQINE